MRKPIVECRNARIVPASTVWPGQAGEVMLAELVSAHPVLGEPRGWASIRTSLIVRADLANGEVETLNTLYKVVQSEAQRVLRKVLDWGVYGAGQRSRCEFMCLVLSWAESAGVITSKEATAAGDSIEEYLQALGGDHASVLYRSLVAHDLLPERKFGEGAVEWSACAGREFYRNWDARPYPPEVL